MLYWNSTNSLFRVVFMAQNPEHPIIEIFPTVKCIDMFADESNESYKAFFNETFDESWVCPNVSSIELLNTDFRMEAKILSCKSFWDYGVYSPAYGDEECQPEALSE